MTNTSCTTSIVDLKYSHEYFDLLSRSELQDRLDDYIIDTMGHKVFYSEVPCYHLVLDDAAFSEYCADECANLYNEYVEPAIKLALSADPSAQHAAFFDCSDSEQRAAAVESAIIYLYRTDRKFRDDIDSEALDGTQILDIIASKFSDAALIGHFNDGDFVSC